MSVSEATKKRILRSYFSGKSFNELVKEYQVIVRSSLLIILFVVEFFIFHTITLY